VCCGQRELETRRVLSTSQKELLREDVDVQGLAAGHVGWLHLLGEVCSAQGAEPPGEGAVRSSNHWGG